MSLARNRDLAKARALGRSPMGYDGQAAFYAFAFGICVFFLVAAVSLKQATAPGNAIRVLESGIGTLSEIDILLAQHGDELRTLARNSKESSFEIPGYPLHVTVTRDELLNKSNAELRDILLERSAALVYVEGIGAFDQTGNQSLGFLSTEGLVNQLAGQLSKTTYDRAKLASSVLVILGGLAGVAVVLRNRGFKRMRMLGVATAAGAIPGYLGSLGAGWLLGKVGGGDDPFRADLEAIVKAVASIPERNYLIASAAGLMVTALAIVFGIVDGQFGRDRDEEALDIAAEEGPFGDEPRRRRWR